jgi:hypothetical protein
MFREIETEKVFRILLRIFGGIILAVVAFSIWYVFAADYSYSAVSGTYSFRSGGETSTLVLKKDKTFVQERKSHGRTEIAHGNWYRIGEGGVEFSKDFLPVGHVFPESDGSTYGHVEKVFFELVPSIVLGTDSVHGPRFHRRLF